VSAGRLLCLVGWHRWDFRDEHHPNVSITYARCARSECPRFSEEMVVNLERHPSAACTCRKGAWDPNCPAHGRQAA
jgi:hypothetical protein